MKALTWWKMALSYLVDVPLRKLTSAMNGPMEVFLSRGQYKLTTDHAIYSFGAHYRSFGYAFEQLEIHKDHHLKSALVLGWGIGSIARLLDRHPTLQAITGVEYDQELINLYEELPGSKLSFKVELLLEDAIGYTRTPVNTAAGSFDLVCSDIFIDHITPDEVVTSEYIHGLTHLCRPGGRVLLSKLNSNLQDSNQNNQLEGLLSTAGLKYNVINTIGNRMYTWVRTA